VQQLGWSPTTEDKGPILRAGPGQVVVSQGAEWDRMLAVRSGMLKMSALLPSGRQALISVLGRGDVFGLPTPGPSRPAAGPGLELPRAPWTITALGSCELVPISRDALQDGLDAVPALALAWAGLGARLSDMEARLVRTLAAGVAVRLASALLDLAERFGCRRGGGILLGVPLSQGDLASLVGSSRETVNRSLATFRARRWILTSGPGHSITILDVPGLRAFAEASG
jgi:CRP/FNR family transcriptional regulator